MPDRIVVRQETRKRVNVTTRGPQGPAGPSAYEVAVANGFVGTEEEWLDSLVAEGGGGGVTQAELDAAVAALTSSVDAKQDAATAATDTELGAEASARAAADDALADDLVAEAAARGAADTTLTAAAAAAQATADAALPKAGGTMTGAIVLAGDPTANLEPATRQYVLAQINALIAGAPGTLDTLAEIAERLDDDADAVSALTAVVTGKLTAASNLSDLADAAAARTNLGLGTAAIADSVDFDPAGAAAAAQAASQPLSSDLTAIDALTTVAFGRGLLELADAAAGRTALGIADADRYARRATVYNEFKNPRGGTNTTSVVATAGSLTRITNDGVSDATSFEASHSATTGVVFGSPVTSDAVPVHPGQVVVVRCQAKPVAFPAGGIVGLYATFYTAAGASIGSARLVDSFLAADFSGEWEEMTGFADAPATAAFVVIAVQGLVAGAWTLRATDCLVSIDPPEGVPCYGAGDEGFNASWLGTAHASRSRFGADVAPSNVIVASHGLPALQGIVSGQQQADLEHELGVDHSRFGILLAELEPTQGARDLTVYDDLFDAYRRRDAQVTFLAGLGPAWMTPSVNEATFDAGVYPPDPAFFDEYVDLVSAVVDRYSDVIVAVEGWNEANHPNYWTPGPDAADYYAFQAALHDGIKADHPDVTILAGALWPGITTGSPANAIAYDEFLDDLYDAGTRKWDAISFHCYPVGPTSATPAAGGDAATRTSWEQMLREIRVVLAAKSDPDRPLWVTEAGISTTATDPPCTERQQAHTLRSLIYLADQDPQVEMIAFHTLIANPANGATTVGHELFETPSFTPKPAALAIREILRPTARKAFSEWHYVGAVGEPTFDADWGNFGSGYTPLRFRLRDGRVELQGTVKRNTAGTSANETIFTLPSKYRPQFHQPFNGDATATVNALGTWQVLSTGEVQWISGTPNALFSIEASWPAAGS